MGLQSGEVHFFIYFCFESLIMLIEDLELGKAILERNNAKRGCKFS